MGQSADDVLDGVRPPVESSLVVVTDDVPAEPRYRMLDTVHEYAVERLRASGELDAMRQRHCRYYLDLAEQAEPALQDRDQHIWYPRLEREHENLRAALDWLLRSGDVESAFWRRTAALPSPSLAPIRGEGRRVAG